ncbi:MAG: SDR family oxidoreductase, partial [Spirochaetaceae bacterium]
AKGGLLTLTHHIARNYAKNGIRCNWVTVGWVITPGEIEVWEREKRSPEWIEEKAKEVVPLGRLQTAEEIGAAVAYLMSDDADQVTDTELDITGGLRV